ncbi:MAG: hypothetical protein IH624_06390 [Phycisphaerae bacterium]|nr:hypothetical protein [Phycisphaerae bacterium]
MFDLTNAVENWRRELSQSEAIAAADLNEMETHLREEIEGLAGRGLTEEEAFVIAARRLGSAGDLTCEFAKVNGAFIWQRRLFWMLAGVMLFMVAHAVAGVAAKALSLASTYIGLRGERVGLLESFISTAVLIITFYGVYRILGLNRKTHAATGPIKRSASTAALLITAAVIVFVCTAATRFVPLIQLRFLGPEEVGRMALGAAYGWALWAVIAPFALATILILMSRTKRCKVA